ncbi:Hypothetical Protein FCC1311_009502 [Hondaea fermentalgiana]|uniref:Uncharacterized protein n=1 Tax=Hondaea fermentalgiana TaxID=2315210 RepID=A0A2R5G159_9STRA|nr:Hypothetical Protein FCC1311_009502 [Hondaea fermentalgiana]|eukprot:GBG24732.1 Hypothetical Protein FCC1311_009502 [Hondaea fermentalgiana]
MKAQRARGADSGGSSEGDDGKEHFPCAIPDTLLYESGAPRKLMRADAASGDATFELLAMDDPRVLLDVVLKMSTTYNQCLIWYTSGECEELSVTRLFEVFSSLEWQRQIVCVQGYTPPTKHLVPLDYPMFSLCSDPDLVQVLDRLTNFLNTWSPQHTIKGLTARFALYQEDDHAARTKAGFPSNGRVEDANGASAAGNSKAEADANSSGGLDLSFEDYAQVYSSTVRDLVDIVLVEDCLEPFPELRDFARTTAQKGLRVILVSLFKDTRPAAIPPSNVLLSNWLHRLMDHLGVGKGRKRPWVLAGVGVGANVAMHMAAYRKCTNLQAVVSVNGFAHVDRTLLRASRSSLAEEVHPEASRILASLRTEFLDLRSALHLLRVPMVLVQSTESRLVLPMHVETILNTRGAPRTISSSLRDCIRHQDQVQNHVMWLKAGHNVWSSRQDFMSNLFDQIYGILRNINDIQLIAEKQEQEIASPAGPEAPTKDSEEAVTTPSQVIEESPQEDDADGLAELDRTHSRRHRSQRRRKGRHHNKSNTDSSSESDDDEDEDDEDLSTQAGAQRRGKARARSRSRDTIERERAEREALRQKEAKRLRMELFWKNRPTEAEERSMMMDADSFSKDLRRTWREEQRWIKQQALVKERLEELQKARDTDKAREEDQVKRKLERDKTKRYLTRQVLLDDDAEAAINALEDGMETTAVLGSSVSGASKIRLDFIRIAQRQALDIEHSQALLAKIKDTQAQRDTSAKRVAELERAIILLRATAHVGARGKASRQRMRKAEQASAELGDVVKSRDETVSLVHAINVKLKDMQSDISKVNSRIQTDAIILQRRANEMDDMVARLTGLLQELDEENASLRVRRKEAVRQHHSITGLHEIAQARLQDIEDELERCRHIDTKYCDSSIWQAGVMQRIRTSELINYLTSERLTIAERIEYMAEEVTSQEESITRVDSRLAQLQRDRANVVAQRKFISGALVLFRSGEIKRKAQADYQQQQEEQANKEKLQSGALNGDDEYQDDLVFSSSKGKSAGGDRNGGAGKKAGFTRQTFHADLASEVRRKPPMARTQDEREWIALDMCINRYSELYEEEDVHNYRHYRPTELTDEIIDVLYELPEELNLALPFIRSVAQMRAYQLIQRFSFGNDPDELLRLDRVNARLRRKGEKQYRVFNSAEHYRLTLQEEDRLEADDDKTAVLLRDSWTRLYHVDEQVLNFRQGRVHSFFMPHDLVVIQLVVHVVYKGGFDERGYANGRLSAALYLNETIPIGVCSQSHEVSLSASDAMGRFTLIHDPEEDGIPLQHGRYQVVVGAASLTQYSITVLAETCKSIKSVEFDARSEALALHDRLIEIDEATEHLTVSLYLSERKLSLVAGIVKDAEARCESLENEMAMIARVLLKRREREELGPGFTPEKGQDEEDFEIDEETLKKCTAKNLSKLEREFDKWVRLAASRRTEHHDCRRGTADMANAKRELREEKATKTSRLAALKRMGMVTEEEIALGVASRTAKLSAAAERDRQNAQTAIENILSEQSNADACWSDAYLILHPESAIRAGDPDPSLQAPEGTCNREDLLALMFTETETLQGPKAIIMHHLLRERAHPLERGCLVEPMLREPRMLRHEKLTFDVKAAEVVTDVDRRCRLVLVELERANESKDAFMDSSVLHSSEQRFPIRILRKELNRELDRLLLLQVKEQETFILKELRRKERDSLILAQATKEDDLAELMSSSDEEDEEEEEDDGDENDEGDDGDNEIGNAKARERQSKDDGNASDDDGDPDSTAARINAAKAKAAAERAFCQACNTSPCSYEPPVDLVKTEERKMELRKELEAVRRIDVNVKFVESTVARSVKQGGNSRMLRTDLLRELDAELISLERKIRLQIVDEELHMACASKSAFVETKALHGYKQVQWTQNVVLALENERGRLLGGEVVEELIDGVLDFMLEGWIFGERDSEVFKPATGDHDNEDNAGSTREPPAEKWASISRSVARRERRQKAVDMKADVKHQLDETENVLRFGIFTMTLMYFRAMTLLRKSRFDGRHGPGSHHRRRGANSIGMDAAAIAAERQRMQSTAAHVAGRKRAMDFAMEKASAGEKVRHARVEKRLEDERAKLQKRAQQARREATAAIKIQSVARGHLGRRAAVAWAARRLQIIALENLREAAAIALQRVFRGFQARKIAEDRRFELAEFVAAIRAAEAKEEEEEFFRQNPLQRIIHNARRLLRASRSPKPGIMDEGDDAILDPDPPGHF